MKQGKSLTELAIEIDRINNAKRDFLADTRQLHMDPIGGVNDADVSLSIGGEARTSITTHTHTQIAERLKIPMPYYRRMLDEAPQLLSSNVNHWFSENPERRMVRTLDGYARAFLSERYRPLDNYDLLQCVLPELTNEPDMKIESCDLTATRMYVKALFPRRELEVKVGDIVQSGLTISNSEVGAGSLRVEPFVFRLECLNGMIGQSALRKYHVGRGHDAGTGDGALEIFRDETLEADDKAFWLKTRDTIRSALNDAAFEQLVKSMQDALEVRIEADPVAVVERTAKRFSLTDGERGDVLRHLIDGGDLSKYGLLNAVTRASQDVEDYQRATDLERLGGTILELPRTEWTRLNAAA